MTLGSKEHYDLISTFERCFGKGMRLDKESKEYQKRGYIYQNSETNTAFKFFCQGYALAKSEFQH